jgi:hypothetical protein
MIYIPSCEQQLLTCNANLNKLVQLFGIGLGCRLADADLTVFSFSISSVVWWRWHLLTIWLTWIRRIHRYTEPLACILSGANNFLYCETWTLNIADHRCFIFLLISNPHDISKMSHIASHFNRTSEPHQLNHHVMLIASHLPVWRLKR